MSTLLSAIKVYVTAITDRLSLEIDSKADSSSLAKVATSGKYTDLTNRPAAQNAILYDKSQSLTNSQKKQACNNESALYFGGSQTLTDTQKKQARVNIGLDDYTGFIPTARIVTGTTFSGQFLVINSSGKIAAVTMATWQGGSY